MKTREVRFSAKARQELQATAHADDYVLTLTNLYPSVGKPHAAPFIRARLRAHSEIGSRTVAVALDSRPTLVARGLLKSRGHVSALDTSDSALLSASIPLSGAQLIRRRWGASRKEVRNTVGLVIAMRLPRPSLIHAHGMFDPPAGEVARLLAAHYQVPYLITLHGSDVNVLLPQRLKQYRRAFTEASGMIYVSQALRERTESLTGGHRSSHVIGNGFDASDFHIGHGQRHQPPTMLFAGNLELVKGADLLPRIFARVREELPNARLEVVGSGSLHSRLRGAFGPDATLHGAVAHSDVGVFMRQTDVLLLPSRSEGSPTVIGEAYACGVPVVAADVGGVSELILHEQDLIPLGDAFEERFAQAVVRRLKGRDQIPSLDLSHSVASMEWRNIAARECALYDEVLRRNGR